MLWTSTLASPHRDIRGQAQFGKRIFILRVRSKQSDQNGLHGYFIFPSLTFPQHRLKQRPNGVSALDQYPQAAEHTGKVRGAPQVGASVAALSVVERVEGDSGGEVGEGEDVDGSGRESGEVGSELKDGRKIMQV